MSSTGRTRGDVKREAIICAAKTAFQTYGVAGTSMDKLAEMANVSKRTVYNHFSAKEEIVMHLIRTLWHKTMASIPIQYLSQDNLDHQLSQILLAEIELITGDEYLELSRVAFGYFFYRPEKLRCEVEQLTAQETVLQKWLRAAIEDGKLAINDMEKAINILSGQVKGQCFWPQLMKIKDPLTAAEKREVAGDTASLFLSYYLTRT